MANLNRYLDELSLIKVLLFFILVILVMTLFGMVFNIEYGFHTCYSGNDSVWHGF